MDDDYGGIIGIFIILAVMVFIVYCIVLIASVIVAIAGIGGTLWGGGTALVNYIVSFKENMIDSNKAFA